MVKDAFTVCVEHVLLAEGGWAAVKGDAGGLTRWGISSRAHPGVDLQSLTRDGAIEIYRRDYWQPIQGDSLPIAAALIVFDAAVNQGRERAIGWLQASLSIGSDGIMGPRTLGAKAWADIEAVIWRFSKLRGRAYLEAARVNRTAFPGWSDRLHDSLRASLMLLGPTKIV